MKHQSSWCVATAFLMAVPGVVTGQNILNSPHDFSGQTWNPTQQICLPCHAPHNNVATVANAPLWNHDTTSVASFQTYTSPTLTATVGNPTGTSKLCLSCHDGTVALDAFGGSSGSVFITNANGDSLGTDLRNDHPISFIFNTTLASSDGGLFDPSTQLSGIPGTSGTIAQDMLFSGSLECASCHDVHNAQGIAKLLRKSNSSSGLCLTCHDK